MYSIFSLLNLYWPLGIFGTLFWFWMLYDCLRNEPDRGLWMWIMIILNLPGAFLYFLLRKLPQFQFDQWPIFKRLATRNALQRAEYDAENIGNAAQFVRLGDLRRDMKDFKLAKAAYDKALEKDRNDLEALWGSSLTDYELKLYSSAKEKLQDILQKDPKFKFGDASLALGRVLYMTKDHAAAKAHLLEHLKRHGNSEARVIMATILKEEGQKEEARKHLEIVLEDARGLPAFHKVRNRAWINKAKRMLWKL